MPLGTTRVAVRPSKASSTFTINPGDRIAQAIICPIIRPEIVEGAVDDITTRSAGGFGSTGVK